MALKVGIVGLPNSGKSTLFNALLKRSSVAKAMEDKQADLSTEAPKGAKVENRPFTTIEPNIGVVDVPDERLAKLYELVVNSKSEILNSKQIQKSKKINPKIIPATVEFVDIAGLVKGASEGAGLGNKFLSHIREVDAVIILLRSFTDASIIHVEGKVDPQNDLEILLLELQLADEAHPEAPKLFEKPRLVVYNVDESELGAKTPASSTPLGNTSGETPGVWDPLTPGVKERVEESGVFPAGVEEPSLRVSAKLESELATLDQSDQDALLKELGVTEPPLNRVIREGYRLLGLQTFFTAGPEEVRAWTVTIGATAPQAAGVIHTDFQKGFIKAEVIGYDDYIACAGEQGAKAAGKLRTEGKEYVMQEGDVVHFRFNV